MINQEIKTGSFITLRYVPNWRKEDCKMQEGKEYKVTKVKRDPDTRDFLDDWIFIATDCGIDQYRRWWLNVNAKVRGLPGTIDVKELEYKDI